MRRPPRTAVLASAAVLVAAGAVALLPSVSASAATACTVDYSVTSQWSTGFQGNVVITNNSAPTSTWALTFDFPGTQKVTQGWSGKWSQTGTTVTATNESWNGTLATGGSVSAGFLADFSGSNPAPTAFKLNGTTCNTDATPPPPPPPPPPPLPPPQPRPPPPPSSTSPATNSSTRPAPSASSTG